MNENVKIEVPDLCWSAEAVANAYFMRLAPGATINGNRIIFKKNNVENKYLVDFAIHKNGAKISWLDTEYKPGWKRELYPFVSVARYTYGYNKGLTSLQNETNKVKAYRQFPDRTFFMLIKSDMKQAAITTGRVVIDSPLSTRPQPKGFARDIEIFEFSNDKMVLCDAFDPDIEDYIIQQLLSIGEL